MFEIKFEISSGASCPHLFNELKRVDQNVVPHNICKKACEYVFFFVVIDALKLLLTNPTKIVIISFTNSRKQGFFDCMSLVNTCRLIALTWNSISFQLWKNLLKLNLRVEREILIWKDKKWLVICILEACQQNKNNNQRDCFRNTWHTNIWWAHPKANPGCFLKYAGLSSQERD